VSEPLSEKTKQRPSAPPEVGERETCTAKVRKVRYSKPDGDFAILELDHLERKEAVIAVGSLAHFQQGERLTLTGRYERHSRFGLQLRVESAYAVAPDTSEAIEEYLLNAKIKGLGPALARKIVKAFGDETLKVISERPERLEEISGLGEQKRAALQEAVKAHAGQREVMVFLHGLNLGAALAGKVWGTYGDATVERVKENPYRLVRDIEQIAFQRADQIARLLGWAPDTVERAEAALEHLLTTAQDEGHACLPRDQLLARATNMIGEYERCEEGLQGGVKRGGLILEERFGAPFVYLSYMALYEDEAALQVKALLRVKRDPLKVKWDQVEQSLGVKLADGQREAVEQAGREGVLLLTGGPGTGKTTTLKALVKLFELHDEKVLLAAPTGRAARRITETSRRDAQTLHRLLDYHPPDNTFHRDAQRPLEGDVIIIDEASMIDLRLFCTLMRAVPARARLILVGDMNQLPSVGAGRVYHDLLASSVIPTIELTEVFRQAQESQIIANAYQVLQGQPLLPPVDPEQEADLYHFAVESAEHGRAMIEQLISDGIPSRFSIAPRDIQVLTPMYRGACGADSLNSALQRLINPDGQALKKGLTLKGNLSCQVGDKVMQLKNLYDKDVFNGDIGEVITAVPTGALVDFEGRIVQYTKEELRTLTLAYACSIHKSQGSEYEAVVIPVLEEHWSMLQRDLLYTAITRGKRLVVIISQARAIQRAILTLNSHQRFGHLIQRLEAGW